MEVFRKKNSNIQYLQSMYVTVFVHLCETPDEK